MLRANNRNLKTQNPSSTQRQPSIPPLPTKHATAPPYAAKRAIATKSSRRLDRDHESSTSIAATAIRGHRKGLPPHPSFPLNREAIDGHIDDHTCAHTLYFASPLGP